MGSFNRLSCRVPIRDVNRNRVRGLTQLCPAIERRGRLTISVQNIDQNTTGPTLDVFIGAFCRRLRDTIGRERVITIASANLLFRRSITTTVFRPIKRLIERHHYQHPLLKKVNRTTWPPGLRLIGRHTRLFGVRLNFAKRTRRRHNTRNSAQRLLSSIDRRDHRALPVPKAIRAF